MTCEEIVARLEAMANPANLAGMARYGIDTTGALGVPMPALRALAREIGRDHARAGRLWRTAVHEARILASLTADPARMTSREMDLWVRDLNSWDVCDQLCQNLLRWSPLAFAKALRWSGARAEFTRRAAFSLMAGLAVKSKEADEAFEPFLALIETAASDERNMVKKAVNWALRQIGKRNDRLRAKAIEAALRIREQPGRAARWIAADALRELRGAPGRS